MLQPCLWSKPEPAEGRVLVRVGEWTALGGGPGEAVPLEAGSLLVLLRRVSMHSDVHLELLQWRQASTRWTPKFEQAR